MDESKFIEILIHAFEIVQSVAPIRTGNLRYNAIKLEDRGNGEWAIVADEDIAPYMPFTTEPWLSPKWNGKKNPNEGWWEDTAEIIAMYIAEELGGELITTGGEEDDNDKQND